MLEREKIAAVENRVNAATRAKRQNAEAMAMKGEAKATAMEVEAKAAEGLALRAPLSPALSSGIA